MITIADVQAWRAPEIKPIFEQNKFPPVSDVEESVSHLLVMMRKLSFSLICY